MDYNPDRCYRLQGTQPQTKSKTNSHGTLNAARPKSIKRQHYCKSIVFHVSLHLLKQYRKEPSKHEISTQ